MPHTQRTRAQMLTRTQSALRHLDHARAVASRDPDPLCRSTVVNSLDAARHDLEQLLHALRQERARPSDAGYRQLLLFETQEADLHPSH